MYLQCLKKDQIGRQKKETAVIDCNIYIFLIDTFVLIYLYKFSKKSTKTKIKKIIMSVYLGMVGQSYWLLCTLSILFIKAEMKATF